MKNLTLPKSQKVSIIVLLVILVLGIPLALYQSQISQIIRQFAWQTSQTATVVCSGESNNLIIKVQFTNNEPVRDIEVVAKDIQTGKSVAFGTIPHGQTKSADIDTGSASLKDGVVLFDLRSVGASATTYDQFAANYKGITACADPYPSTTPPVCQEPNQGFCRWDPQTGATAYKVIVKETGSGATVKEEVVQAPNTQSAFSMEPNKTYQCNVSTVNSCGTGISAASPQKSCPVPTPPPFCPAEPLTTSSCVWDPLQGATAYKVDIINAETDEVIKSEQVNAPNNRLVYPSEPGVAYKCSVAPVNACTGGTPVVSQPKVCVNPSGTPMPTIPYPSETPAPTEEIPTPTETPVPTETPAPTPTLTPIPTATPRPTATPTPRPTSTPIPTPTRIPTPTPRLVLQPGQTIVQRGGVQIVEQKPQVIVVTQTQQVVVQNSPRPTVKPTGDTNVPVIIGGLTLIMALAGALVFFAL